MCSCLALAFVPNCLMGQPQLGVHNWVSSSTLPYQAKEFTKHDLDNVRCTRWKPKRQLSLHMQVKNHMVGQKTRGK